MKALPTTMIAAVVFSIATFSISSPAQAPSSPTEKILLDRIKVMEDQVSVLKAELESLRSRVEAAEQPKPLAAGTGRSTDHPERNTAAPTSSRKPAEQAAGIEIGNGVRLIPYGTIYFNSFVNTSGTNNSDVPLWATAADQSNTGMSLRQTRFGVRFEGAKAGNAALSGVVEADFYGGLPAIGVGENFGVVRLRVAKFKLDWERSSLLVGQDWVIFAPLNPSSIAAAAIPQFAASGNLWARLPQARIETRFGGGRFLYQGAVLAPTSGDFPSGSDSPFLLQPGAASRSGSPSVESRLAFTGPDFLGTKKPGTIALSAHFGRTKVYDSALGSYGLAVDWSVPLVKRVGLTGEAFVGQNLGGLQGGVFQGYNTDYGRTVGNFASLPEARAIRSAGGWTQISVTPPVLGDRLTLFGSFGIDDPYNNDLFSVTPRNWRSRNRSYALSFIFKPIPNLSVGGEFRRFHTTYLLTGERTAEHLNFGAAYSF